MTNVNEEIEARTEHARRVRAMFEAIAARYDLLNHLLSANFDRGWRQAVVERVREAAGQARSRVLDVACGTGDLALAIASQVEARVIGLDFCRPMLTLAKRKAAVADLPLLLIEGDALRLPFADATFDIVTIAFGLRNLASVEAGLGEFRRVLRPGGMIAILEFSHPQVPGFRALFNLYFDHLLPRIGGWISGDRQAYQYLPRSVRNFPDQRKLAKMMEQMGFQKVSYRNLTGGIAAIHVGVR